MEATTTEAPIRVTVDIRNTGERVGVEVAQLYCQDLTASIARPNARLVGFARVLLTPRETRRVTFEVHPSRLAFYDPAMRFVVESGAFAVQLGSSSADIRAETTVILDGRVVQYQQWEIVATTVSVSEALPR